MRVVAWLSLVSTSAVLAACGGYTNLGNGPEGEGGQDDGTAGSSTQSGGKPGGSTGKGGSGTAGTVSTGTGGTLSMGTGGSFSMGGSGTTPIAPCAGLPCGSTCVFGAVPMDMGADADGNGSSDVPVTVGYCAEDGSCGLAFPMCSGTMCSTSMDCPPLPASCGVCADGTVSCPTNACVDGVCVVDAPGCGNQCETGMDCVVPSVPCQMCADGTTSCPRVDCVMGQCVSSVPGCGTREPCSGLSCGDPCSPCDPGDMDCPQSSVLSYCNATGVCQTGAPNCGSGNQCMAAMDCPQTELCYMCADGSCGEMDCVNGRCGHVCPETPAGMCMTTADCGTPPPICQDCGDGTCAQMACVNGSCRMICNATQMCAEDGECPQCGQCGNLDVCVPFECDDGLCKLDCTNYGSAD